MILSGRQLREVSFPVGGIGAGCVGVAGNGRLVDWEIFNHPSKNSSNGLSHFAVRAVRAGRLVDSRVLSGDLQSGFSGEGKGFGFSAPQGCMCGFPHFRDLVFRGEFPVAELSFSDGAFPGHALLRAWSPFVPGESDTASMPCAVFEIEITNTTDEVTEYDCAGILGNPWRQPGSENLLRQTDGVTQIVCRCGLPENDFEFGEVALSVHVPDVSFQQYFYRGTGMDRYEVYQNDWGASASPLKNRVYGARTGEEQENDTCILAGRLRLAPGERGRVPFILSWYVPNCRNTFEKAEKLKKEMADSGIPENRWKNYYTKLCSGAADAAKILFNRFDRVRANVMLFRDVLHRSSLPPAALEGAAENLEVLISPTCLRAEDGTFWAWEGCGTSAGSCHGTCQHVWNYPQALPFLFPDLERSIRESMAKYNLDENGAWHFRLSLPLGIQARTDWFRPCADGSFGEVMKIFREWKISGDTDWMKSMFPAVKAAISWAWSPENTDRWDPGKTGLLSGRQHHTLDTELFGPNGWLAGHYLGALKAASVMAPLCGEEAFGRECADLFERGRNAVEKELYNGEYYIQKIDLTDKSVPDSFEEQGAAGPTASFYWDTEHAQVKYQIGEGCEIDCVLAQWYATLYGIGRIFDPEHERSSMNAVYKYNFRKSMRDCANTWRVYSMDDEAGLVMCSWPEGTVRPVIPLCYNSETMTGFEWAAASHLVLCGEPEKGAEIAEAIRGRYTGEKRNPWNEIECGSNYARAMAAYAMLPSYSGFTFDMTCGKIGFKPVPDGDFRCFWSLGTVWGEYIRTAKTQTVRILHGSAQFREFALAASGVRKNGEALSAHLADGVLRLDVPVNARADDEFTFEVRASMRPDA